MRNQELFFSMNKSLKPHLNTGKYVFVQLKRISEIDKDEIVCFLNEGETLSVILNEEYAKDNNLLYESINAWITLKINSSLDSVGLTSLFSKALADLKISCNVISGYKHDHIFVNYDKRDLAINALKKLKF